MTAKDGDLEKGSALTVSATLSRPTAPRRSLYKKVALYLLVLGSIWATIAIPTRTRVKKFPIAEVSNEISKDDLDKMVKHYRRGISTVLELECNGEHLTRVISPGSYFWTVNERSQQVLLLNASTHQTIVRFVCNSEINGDKFCFASLFCDRV